MSLCMEKIEMIGPWITEHEIKVIEDMMRNGWYGDVFGYCERFQEEFAAYHGRKHAILTPNCTTAIHLLLTALDVKDGDEVILPECTWIATGAGITYLRATPIFCDIDKKHWCIDPVSVENAITERTKAIIAVDIFGNMPDMDALKAIAEKHDIYLIEDAAEALGSIYKGQRAGSFGIGSVFSFHRSKTITTGEGGMLLIDDDELYERCLFLRDHGRKKDGKMYYNYEVTYKYMPSNFQAALGYAQFQRIEEIVARKRWLLSQYRNGLRNIDDILLNPEPEGGVNGAWITGVLIGKTHKINKLEAMDVLATKGVPVRPFFYPLSSLPAYDQEVKYKEINMVAYDICDRGINLPTAGNLTKDQIRVICESIENVLTQ